MSAEFSSKSEEVLGRRVCVDQRKRHVELNTYYEIDRCKEFLEPYSKVCSASYVKATHTSLYFHRLLSSFQITS